MWYDVADRLAPDLFTMDLMDVRGCGRSDRPSRGHDLEGYASDVRGVLADIGGPVTLVAHSMGAKIAQFLACEASGAIERLILVAPGVAAAVRPSPRHRAQTLETFGSRRAIERFTRAAMFRAPSQESFERLVDDALLAQYEHWIGWYDRGRSADFAGRLDEIRVPTLAIAGEKDPLVSPARVKRDLTNNIEGALLVTLRGAGHNLPVETPAEIAAAIERFTA